MVANVAKGIYNIQPQIYDVFMSEIVEAEDLMKKLWTLRNALDIFLFSCFNAGKINAYFLFHSNHF